MNAEEAIYTLITRDFPDLPVAIYELPNQIAGELPKTYLQIIPEGNTDNEYYAPLFSNDWRFRVHGATWSEVRSVSFAIHDFLYGLTRRLVDDTLIYSASAAGSEYVDREDSHGWPIIERTYTIHMSAISA